MAAATSIRFGLLARRLGEEARRHGLAVPSFRSPPRVPGARRTIRRPAAGGVIVAVQVHGRPWEDVAADMVEGVLATNGLGGIAADGWRLALRTLLAPAVEEAEEEDARAAA